jgi:hypothetical protein
MVIHDVVSNQIGNYSCKMEEDIIHLSMIPDRGVIIQQKLKHHARWSANQFIKMPPLKYMIYIRLKPSTEVKDFMVFNNPFDAYPTEKYIPSARTHAIKEIICSL